MIALTVALGYAVFERAGVDPNDWNAVLLAIGVIALLHFARSKDPNPPPLDRITRFSTIAVLSFTALQLVPLPIGLVRAISPTRAELLKATLPFVVGAPGYTTLSAVPYQTAQYFLTLSAYFLVFLIVRNLTLTAKRWPWMAAWPLLVVGAFEAILGLFQAYGEGSMSGMATGTYANRDHYAGLLEMILPFPLVYAVAILQRQDKRFESPASPVLKACPLLAAAAFTLVAIILSLSRMGFLSALAALLVAGATMLSLRGWHVDYQVPGARWRRWLPAVMVGLVVIAGFVFLPTDPLIARFSDLANTEQISADTRAQIWHDTGNVVKAYPLFGCGMGAYESCFLRYKTVAPMNTVDYAHNDYLQVLAELGVFGFAAGLFFVGRLVQRTARGTFYARSVDERYLAIACLAAMSAILLHSLVDFNMYVPANGLAFAWIAGIAGAQLRAPAPQRAGEKKSPAEH
ncbi:MAG: O-antigen ligase family protein [Bryobacteraceae bacterium]